LAVPVSLEGLFSTELELELELELEFNGIFGTGIEKQDEMKRKKLELHPGDTSLHLIFIGHIFNPS
jgi:hypothetical protein